MRLLVLTIPSVDRPEQHGELGPFPRRFHALRSWNYAR
jgi:hypothetical protein